MCDEDLDILIFRFLLSINRLQVLMFINPELKLHEQVSAFKYI